MPRVIIQILHFGDVADTLECLESVFRLDYPNFATLVIDNTGADVRPQPALQQLHEQGRIALIKTEENKGFAGGHNLGFSYSIEHGADFIWVLNNDTVVMPGTLTTLMAEMEIDPKLGAVSPVIYDYQTKGLQYAGAIIDWTNLRFIHAKSLEELSVWQQSGKSFSLWGTAILLRTEMLKKVGFFDERLFAYFEDADLSCRILAQGYRNAITKDAVIRHKVDHGDSPSLRRPHYYFYMTRNKLLFSRKHAQGIQVVPVGLGCLRNMLAHLLACSSHQNAACEAAVLDGFYCGLTGRGGPWKQDAHMPKLIGAFLKRAAWPLYRLLSVGQAH